MKRAADFMADLRAGGDQALLSEVVRIVRGASYEAASAEVHNREDYFLGSASEGVLRVSQEVVAALKDDRVSLAEYLFHLGHGAVNPESDKWAHQDRYEGVQRRLFGSQNRLKSALRAVVDSRSPAIAAERPKGGPLSADRRRFADRLKADLENSGVEPAYAETAARVLARAEPHVLRRLERAGLLKDEHLRSIRQSEPLDTAARMRLVIAARAVIEPYRRADLTTAQVKAFLSQMLPFDSVEALHRELGMPWGAIAQASGQVRNVEEWAYRAQTAQRAIEPEIGSRSYALRVVQAQGIDKAAAWVAARKPEVAKLESRMPAWKAWKAMIHDGPKGRADALGDARPMKPVDGPAAIRGGSLGPFKERSYGALRDRLTASGMERDDAHELSNTLLRANESYVERLRVWGLIGGDSAQALRSEGSLSPSTVETLAESLTAAAGAYARSGLSGARIKHLFLRRLMPHGVAERLAAEASTSVERIADAARHRLDLETYVREARSVAERIAPVVGGMPLALRIVDGFGLEQAPRWVERRRQEAERLARRTSRGNAWRLLLEGGETTVAPAAQVGTVPPVSAEDLLVRIEAVVGSKALAGRLLRELGSGADVEALKAAAPAIRALSPELGEINAWMLYALSGAVGMRSFADEHRAEVLRQIESGRGRESAWAEIIRLSASPMTGPLESERKRRQRERQALRGEGEKGQSERDSVGDVGPKP